MIKDNLTTNLNQYGGGDIEKGFDSSIEKQQMKQSLEKSMDDLLNKAHKYYKREGSKGNYKYYYSEKDYKDSKGAQQRLSEVKPGSDHAEALEAKISRIESHGKIDSETKQQQALDKKRDKWESSPEHLDLRYDKSQLQSDIKVLQQELKQIDSDMNSEAGQLGDKWTDDNANEYGGWLEAKEKEITGVEKEIEKIDLQLNKYDDNIDHMSESDMLDVLDQHEATGSYDVTDSQFEAIRDKYKHLKGGSGVHKYK